MIPSSSSSFSTSTPSLTAANSEKNNESNFIPTSSPVTLTQTSNIIKVPEHGWTLHVAPSGHLYAFNHFLKKTTWKLPFIQPDPPLVPFPPPLPQYQLTLKPKEKPIQKKRLGQTHHYVIWTDAGNRFFYNTQSKRSTWRLTPDLIPLLELAEQERVKEKQAQSHNEYQSMEPLNDTNDSSASSPQLKPLFNSTQSQSQERSLEEKGPSLISSSLPDSSPLRKEPVKSTTTVASLVAYETDDEETEDYEKETIPKESTLDPSFNRIRSTSFSSISTQSDPFEPTSLVSTEHNDGNTIEKENTQQHQQRTTVLALEKKENPSTASYEEEDEDEEEAFLQELMQTSSESFTSFSTLPPSPPLPPLAAPTLKDVIEQFYLYLDQKHISPFMSWDQLQPTLPSFDKLLDSKELKRLFDMYCELKAPLWREAKLNESINQLSTPSQKKDPKQVYTELVQSNRHLFWEEFKQKYKKDVRFYAFGQHDKEREAVFRMVKKKPTFSDSSSTSTSSTPSTRTTSASSHTLAYQARLQQVQKEQRKLLHQRSQFQQQWNETQAQEDFHTYLAESVRDPTLSVEDVYDQFVRPYLSSSSSSSSSSLSSSSSSLYKKQDTPIVKPMKKSWTHFRSSQLRKLIDQHLHHLITQTKTQWKEALTSFLQTQFIHPPGHESVSSGFPFSFPKEPMNFEPGECHESMDVFLQHSLVDQLYSTTQKKVVTVPLSSSSSSSTTTISSRSSVSVSLPPPFPKHEMQTLVQDVYEHVYDQIKERCMECIVHHVLLDTWVEQYLESLEKDRNVEGKEKEKNNLHDHVSLSTPSNLEKQTSLDFDLESTTTPMTTMTSLQKRPSTTRTTSPNVWDPMIESLSLDPRWRHLASFSVYHANVAKTLLKEIVKTKAQLILDNTNKQA